MGSTKNVLIPQHVIVGAAMTGNIVQAKATNIAFMDNVCVQLNFTGSPTGTFSISGSADHVQDAEGNVQVAGNFVPITLSPAPAATGSGNNILINMNQLSFPYIQISYTFGSGTGTLDAYIGAKST